MVRAYNAENYQRNKFENANQALTGTNLFAQRSMAFPVSYTHLTLPTKLEV